MRQRRYLRRARVERENLIANSWYFQEDARGEFWRHPRVPGHTFSRRAAATLQASWRIEENHQEKSMLEPGFYLCEAPIVRLVEDVMHRLYAIENKPFAINEARDLGHRIFTHLHAGAFTYLGDKLEALEVKDETADKGN